VKLRQEFHRAELATRKRAYLGCISRSRDDKTRRALADHATTTFPEGQALRWALIGRHDARQPRARARR
jgi:hypothetical protein